MKSVSLIDPIFFNALCLVTCGWCCFLATLLRSGSGSCYPPPPCPSHAKVPNQYGSYAYCSLDKAADTQVQKEKIAR